MIKLEIDFFDDKFCNKLLLRLDIVKYNNIYKANLYTCFKGYSEIFITNLFDFLNPYMHISTKFIFSLYINGDLFISNKEIDKLTFTKYGFVKKSYLSCLCEFLNGIILDKKRTIYSNMTLNIDDIIVKKSLYKVDNKIIYKIKLGDRFFYTKNLSYSIFIFLDKYNIRFHEFKCKILSDDNFCIIDKISCSSDIEFICNIFMNTLSKNDVVKNIIFNTQNNISNNLPPELIYNILSYI